MPSQRELDEIRERLKTDDEYFSRTCLKIVGRDGDVVPLVYNTGQWRLHQALTRQRELHKPERAIVLKARKLGFSTQVQGMGIRRTTQLENQRGLVVAQDSSTAAELWGIGKFMYSNLQEDLDPPFDDLKPGLVNEREGRFMRFGEPSRHRRSQGHLGVNGYLKTDTAKEVDAGRGYTYEFLHCSEVAMWENPSKLTALLNAVPKRPGTLVVLESTALGHNHFKDRWDRAVEGTSEYVPVFSPWFEEPAYRSEFVDPEEREEFVASVGAGDWGEDEPWLIEQFGLDAEQLRWRREVIVDQCEASLEVWRQEYPATPDEAFRATGRQVFSQVLVTRMLAEVEKTDPLVTTDDNPGPEVGVLRAAKTARREMRGAVVEVPTVAEWAPREATGFSRTHPFWRVWEPPQLRDDETDTPRGAYIVVLDPASGEDETGEKDFHGIQVLDHRTRCQVAEWRDRTLDPDEAAEQALLAALWFNHAWLVIETTGGYGLAAARKARLMWRYPRLYYRKSLEKTKERQEERIGWDSNRTSKVLIEDGMREVLREGVMGGTPPNAGVRSRLLAMEFPVYVKDQKGKTGALPGKHDDLIVPYMIGQHVAQEKPVVTDREMSRTSYTRPTPRYESTGY